MKLYVDGDDESPTLVGTGTEDYIGTGWGHGRYATRYMGSPIADKEKKQWAFYRYHIPDPVYFAENIRITIQQMGGSQFARVAELQKQGAPLIPVTILEEAEIHHVFNFNKPLELTAEGQQDRWTNYYRSDDVSATTYFYLDKPSNELPELAELALRTANLKDAG